MGLLYLYLYPLYRRLGGPQDQSRRVRKISPSPGFDSRTVQSVASRYTDRAIAAHNSQYVQKFIRWKKKAGYKRTFWRTKSRWMVYIKINRKGIWRGRIESDATGPIHCPVTCKVLIFIKIYMFLDHLSDTQPLSNSTAGASLKTGYSFF
jgi:hypothetical protein